MGADVSTIELGLRELTDADVEHVERQANLIVWEARPVSFHFEDAEAVHGLRKTSGRTGTLRIVEISGLDRSACGGTHVRSTAELGPIQVLGWEKIRGNVRVEFVCGGRALRVSKQEHRILTELSRMASTPAAQLPPYFATLRDRLSEAEKAQQRLSAELARRDGEQTYRTIAPSGDGTRRWFEEVKSIDEVVRGRVQAFTKLPRAVALLVGAEPAGVLVACSSDSGLDAGTVLKGALATVGGRGGGSATLAQGGLPDPSVLDVLKRELGFTA
jgi:alanyl-tRNA synthetase